MHAFHLLRLQKKLDCSDYRESENHIRLTKSGKDLLHLIQNLPLPEDDNSPVYFRRKKVLWSIQNRSGQESECASVLLFQSTVKSVRLNRCLAG